KVYDKMPAMVKKRLPEPIKRFEVLSASIEMLGQFGPAAAPAVPGLLRIYQSGDSRFAKLLRPILKTLGRIGPGAAEAIPALLPGLTPGPDQEFFAQTLIRIDSGDDRVGQALRELERQPGYGTFVSNITASCLIVLQPPRPAESGVTSKAPKYPSRWSAFLVVGLLRSEANQTVPIVRDYLDDENGVLRGLAATALGVLGPNAGDALPDLRKCLTDDWGSVREAATNAVLAIESRPRGSSRLEQVQKGSR
ncbi:MAG TPA: HEAT repeat domain-containing protein, partial [Verrucomicrobiae bacterium]|nr:HEAT repeat domain-containing protein [Verrucomicrobiae bacterium]